MSINETEMKKKICACKYRLGQISKKNNDLFFDTIHKMADLKLSSPFLSILMKKIGMNIS